MFCSVIRGCRTDCAIRFRLQPTPSELAARCFFWLQNSALVSTAALDDQYALVLLHKSPQAPVDVSRMCGRRGDSVPNALEVLLYEAHFRWFLHIWLN